MVVVARLEPEYSVKEGAIPAGILGKHLPEASSYIVVANGGREVVRSEAGGRE